MKTRSVKYFLDKVRNNLRLVLKPVIAWNRRKVDFFTQVLVPQDRSPRCRIWRFGESSFPSMRSKSFLSSFTSGRRCRGRPTDFLKNPIISVPLHFVTTIKCVFIIDSQLGSCRPSLSGFRNNVVMRASGIKLRLWQKWNYFWKTLLKISFESSAFGLG